jgi:hypothetical protein
VDSLWGQTERDFDSSWAARRHIGSYLSSIWMGSIIIGFIGIPVPKSGKRARRSSDPGVRAGRVIRWSPFELFDRAGGSSALSAGLSRRQGIGSCDESCFRPYLFGT